MNAARIPVRGFKLKIANSMVGFNFVSLKKQVVKIYLILHISEFLHFVGDFHHIDNRGVHVLLVSLFDWSI